MDKEIIQKPKPQLVGADGWRSVDLDEPGYKFIMCYHGPKYYEEETLKEYQYDRIVYFELLEREKYNKWGEEMVWFRLYARIN